MRLNLIYGPGTRKLEGPRVSQRSEIANIIASRRAELVRYAGVVSGDVAGAEDLVHEAWLRCDQAAAAQTVARPVHLLWRVLRNLSIDRGRRMAHERRTVSAGSNHHALASLPDARRTVEDALLAREELGRIQAALDSLDPVTRVAFEMHRLHGAKLREIGAHLGISVTTAHERVARAVAVIRDAARART